MAAEFFHLHQALKDADCNLDNHESDLYVEATPEARAIVKRSGYCFSTFTSQIDGKLWLDVPFAFTPWWEARA